MQNTYSFKNKTKSKIYALEWVWSNKVENACNFNLFLKTAMVGSQFLIFGQMSHPSGFVSCPLVIKL